MKKLFAALAIPPVFLLASCGPSSIDQGQERLMDQPVGSYELQSRGGRFFMLVVKQNESKQENVVNSKGERGTSICAKFLSLSVEVNQDGQLQTNYILGPNPLLPDLTPANLASYSPKNGERSQLCKFTPASAPAVG